MSEPPPFRAGSRIQVREPAGVLNVPGKGTVPAVFARDDFRSSAGKVVPLRPYPGGAVIGHARICGAVVADDGGSVLFTYEITDLSPGQAGINALPGISS